MINVWKNKNNYCSKLPQFRFGNFAITKLENKKTHTCPTCPLLLVMLGLGCAPLFHSEIGHSENCLEPSWDCELECIADSNEFMVSSVEGIPEKIRKSH